MTSFVTQCPHCHTRFRVSRDQLTAARGVVRCGTCTELFNAARHLQAQYLPATVETSPAPSLLSPVNAPAHHLAPPPARSAISNETRWIHDDLDLDNLDLDEELAKLERQQFGPREPVELEPQRSSIEAHLPATFSKTDDELWAEQWLKTGADPAEPGDLQKEQSDVRSHALASSDIRFTPVTSDNPAPRSPLTPPGGAPSEQKDSKRRIDPSLDGIIESDEDQFETDGLETARTGRDDPLFELAYEPLQLDWQARRRPWGRWLGWGALNLIALVALAAQYGVYNYDELARQDEYRPWFERICPVVGCKLPPRVDIGQIKSSNLVVRSHPDFAGALVVDAIIYNRAPFAQPFPLLEIRFDDIQGKPLAKRSFKPGEYLSGELAGQREMPSQIPIHIALDILDPGTTAVNYSLSFTSPD